VSETLRFFDAIAPRYDRVYARDARELRERLVQARLPEGHVLDLGIGTGRELAWLLDEGHTVTGVELSERMIAICNQRARKVPIVHGDFYAPLPFPDGTFQSAIALFGSLAHPPDPGAHARLSVELARVLAPGAVLVAEMPAPEWDGRVHEDDASGTRIVVRAPSEAEWRKSFSGWTIDFERISAEEIRIRATAPGQTQASRQPL
jgi:SAM-dependent methyltransferase